MMTLQVASGDELVSLSDTVMYSGESELDGMKPLIEELAEYYSSLFE